MTYDPYALPEDVDKNIARIARDVANEFNHSDPADLAQDAWTWIGSFPKQSAKWWYVSPADNTVKFSWRQFKRDVTRVCAEQARKDKRAKLGLSPQDEYNYGRPLVEMYLPFVWHSDVLARIGEVDDGQPRARTDKAVTGDAMAAALDVRTAYEEVIDPGSTWDQTLLLVYGFGYTHQEAADSLDVSRVMITKRVGEAIDAISRALNGTVGGADYAVTGVGTRKIFTNAQAQSIQTGYTTAA